ncbi:MAG: hypothetical protein JOZ20_00970 [Sphingomonas sp.]|nr:hypothetical protein [Sphingomonas sp.]MBW0007015.1 hypothetical protein [Sphingomonas sp.]
MTEIGNDPIFRHRNERQSHFALWLEPWAEEYDIPNGSEIIVNMRGSPRGEPEIDVFDDRATIYAPLGSFVDVVIDGIVQNAELASATITIPSDSSLGTRELTQILFGSFPDARPGGNPLPKSKWRTFLGKIWRT